MHFLDKHSFSYDSLSLSLVGRNIGKELSLNQSEYRISQNRLKCSPEHAHVQREKDSLADIYLSTTPRYDYRITIVILVCGFL